jgi:hypothetical protein
MWESGKIKKIKRGCSFQVAATKKNSEIYPRMVSTISVQEEVSRISGQTSRHVWIRDPRNSECA